MINDHGPSACQHIPHSFPMRSSTGQVETLASARPSMSAVQRVALDGSRIMLADDAFRLPHSASASASGRRRGDAAQGRGNAAQLSVGQPGGKLFFDGA